MCRVSWYVKCHIPTFSNFYQNNQTNWACTAKSTQVIQVIQDTQEPFITITITVNSDDPTFFKNDGKNK